MTWVLSSKNIPHRVKRALMQYLFFRLNQFYVQDNKLASIFVEEAHHVFTDKSWEDFLSEDVPRVRKKNVHYIFATQTPVSFINSACGHIIATNYATFIALANNGLDDAAWQAYRAFGLTDSEIAMINQMPKFKRLALIKQRSKPGANSEIVHVGAGVLGNVLPILQGGLHRFNTLSAVLAKNDDAPLEVIIEKYTQALQCEH
jgi:type IV secretory pathway VirB4 component